MRLGRNLLAGLANSVWAALLGLLVVPQYLKYLGIEAYGLIGVFMTTQALLQLLDMGLASTMNREVARCSTTSKMQEARNLLHTLAVLYWGTAIAIALTIVALAPLIAEYWLKSKTLSEDDISSAVMLMGLVIACRWPIGIYQGVLIGAQRLTVASSVSALMVTLSSLGAIVVLAYVSPTIQAFFIWQAGVGLFHAATMRWAAWRVIGQQVGQRKFDLDALKSIWRFTAGMSSIALSSILFTQMDKVILSKMLELNDFGHYMLATMVASCLYIVVTPLFNVVFPRFSALAVTGEIETLKNTYRLATKILSTLLFPLAMLLVFFSEPLVTIWTNDRALAEDVAPQIALLAMGSAFHGIMFLPYALQLAFGMTWMPFAINITLMIFSAPLTIILVLKYGGLGGAIGWAFLQTFYLLWGTWLTHRHIFQGLGRKWLVENVSFPLAVSSLSMAAIWYLANRYLTTPIDRLAVGLLGALLVSLGMFNASKSTIKIRDLLILLDRH